MERFVELCELEDRRQAKADKGAIKCDCCGGEIRVGEEKYTLYVGKIPLTVCKDCKGNMVSSVDIHGLPDDMEYWG